MEKNGEISAPNTFCNIILPERINCVWELKQEERKKNYDVEIVLK